MNGYLFRIAFAYAIFNSKLSSIGQFQGSDARKEYNTYISSNF